MFVNSRVLRNEKFTIIILNNTRRGGDGEGRGGLGLKSINPSPPRGVGLKSYFIPAPPPLRSGENLRGVKQGGAEAG